MRNVLLLIESSRAYGRGLLRGVARYVRECRDWSVSFQPHGLSDPTPKWVRSHAWDGILARLDGRAMARAVVQTGKPAIDLRGVVPGLSIPYLGVDQRAISLIAAEHLLARGFRHFGFCDLAPSGRQFRDPRREHFCRRIGADGHTVRVYPAGPGGQPGREVRRLAGWVRRLPKPVGVMTGSDDSALTLLDACRRAGVRVPDDLAVVGVDDDELICQLTDPPLTSISLNAERVGYEAAALLERMMAGEPAPAGPVEYPPRGLVPRRSTDVLGVDDPAVASALLQIRRQACNGLRVGELATQLCLSRTTLERRFRAVTGRSPKEEIFRVQLERAKELLGDAHLTLDEVAAQAGFRDARYLCDVFARKVGTTPGAFRREFGAAFRRPTT